MMQKFYITLATVFLICAYGINLDELPLLPALALATLFWGGFAFAASRVELDDSALEEEPDTEDFSSMGTPSQKLKTDYRTRHKEKKS